MKNDFLNGPFYIDSKYALGLVPGLVSLFLNVGPQLAETIPKSELLENIQQKVSSTSSNGNTLNKTVLVLDFKQPVVKYSDWCFLGTQDYIKILRYAKKDPNIGAVVIDVDSGGGQAFGTPEFYDAIKEFTSVKPLVIYSGGYLCSAAYYFAAPATKIIVNPRAEAIGSIGAYTVLVDFKGIYEKLGAKVHTIYSDLSEDKNKYYENVMNGKDADYKEYIKHELNPLVLQFHADMAKVRPHLDAEVFKGGTWNGVQAVEKNLADATGTLEDAINEAFMLMGEETNVQSKNNNNVSKLNFPMICTVLGVDSALNADQGFFAGLFTDKKTVSLTEDQLNALNTALADKDATIASLTAEKGTLTTEKSTLTQANEVLDTTLANALTKAGVTAGADNHASINLLADKVVELGGKPGANTPNIPAGADPSLGKNEEDSKSIWASLMS